MDLLEIPLPSMYEQILGKDQDAWPPEARFLVAEPPQGDGEEAGPQWEGGHNLPQHERAPGRRRRPGQARRGRRDGRQHVGRLTKQEDAPGARHGRRQPPRAQRLRYLLDHGADLAQEGDDGVTVLHHAARKGRCEIVKLLLSRGADVDGNSEHGTPLHLAAVKGHENTVEVLLEHHADVDKVVSSCLVTPLKAALFGASTPCVKLLVQAGANVNDVNNSLARAASEGLTECVKCLLEAGADPNRLQFKLKEDRLQFKPRHR